MTRGRFHVPLRLNEIIHVHECYFLEFIMCITAQNTYHVSESRDSLVRLVLTRGKQDQESSNVRVHLRMFLEKLDFKKILK